MTPLTDIALVATLATATYTDLRWRRIPNALTLPAAAVGVALNFAESGVGGLGTSALGWVAGFALLVVPFVLRGVGAGDVKLLAAVGALGGPSMALASLLMGALLGGIVVPMLLARIGRLGLATGHLAMLRFLPWQGSATLTVGRIPYAPLLAVGGGAAMLWGNL